MIFFSSPLIPGSLDTDHQEWSWPNVILEDHSSEERDYLIALFCCSEKKKPLIFEWDEILKNSNLVSLAGGRPIVVVVRDSIISLSQLKKRLPFATCDHLLLDCRVRTGLDYEGWIQHAANCLQGGMISYLEEQESLLPQNTKFSEERIWEQTPASLRNQLLHPLDFARAVDRYLTDMACKVAENGDWNLQQLHESAIESALASVIRDRLLRLEVVELAAMYHLLRYPSEDKNEFEKITDLQWPDLHTGTPARFLIRRTLALPEPIDVLKNLGADFVLQALPRSDAYAETSRLIGRMIQYYEPLSTRSSDRFMAIESIRTSGWRESADKVDTLRKQLADTTDPEAREVLLSQLVEQLISFARGMMFHGNDPAEIEAVLREAGKCLDEHPEPGYLAKLRLVESEFNSRLGNIEEALERAKEALTLHAELGDVVGQVKSLLFISKPLIKQGKFDVAQECLEESIRISRKSDEKKYEGEALDTLSAVYLAQGEYDTAEEYLKESLRVYRETGDKSGEGIVLNSMSLIFNARGDSDTALEYLEESLRISRETGDKSEEGVTLNNVSQIYKNRGDYDTALKYLDEARSILEAEDAFGLCATLLNMGHLYARKQESEKAFNVWTKAYQIAAKSHLAQALDVLEDLAPKVGIQGGLDGWAALAEEMDEGETSEA